jgi:triosephosphate isomerase
MKKYTIIGNWKMNMNALETKAFFSKLNDIKNYKNTIKIICPAFPLLPTSIRLGKKSGTLIGAQNVSMHDKGAHTGEISANILKSININYCIIGHSERRQFYGDTNKIIREKWLQLRKENINPIICVGETLNDREKGITENVLKTQINQIFKDIDILKSEKMCVAYEPVWAIGTGKTATPEQAQEAHEFIRSCLLELYGSIANKIPLLYGGSVKPSNIKELLSQRDINGALIGGASLDPTDFANMVETANLLSQTTNH